MSPSVSACSLWKNEWTWKGLTYCSGMTWASYEVLKKYSSETPLVLFAATNRNMLRGRENDVDEKGRKRNWDQQWQISWKNFSADFVTTHRCATMCVLFIFATHEMLACLVVNSSRYCLSQILLPMRYMVPVEVITHVVWRSVALTVGRIHSLQTPDKQLACCTSGFPNQLTEMKALYCSANPITRRWMLKLWPSYWEQVMKVNPFGYYLAAWLREHALVGLASVNVDRSTYAVRRFAWGLRLARLK